MQYDLSYLSDPRVFALGREDAERKGLHHASPLSIFFALASASSSVPTL